MDIDYLPSVDGQLGAGYCTSYRRAADCSLSLVPKSDAGTGDPKAVAAPIE